MIRRAATALALALLVLFTGGQAHATGYRYWSFWERQGEAWTYATQGPSLSRPADGDVQGFRFAISEDSQRATKPRGTTDFATICADTPAQSGKKRVAIVLDFGTAEDAPSGEKPPARRTVCARVREDATTADALAAVVPPLRYDTNALLCAIAGYPHQGCGEQIRDTAQSKPDESSTSSHGTPSAGLLVGAVAVAALGGAAIWQARRRRS
ncbi:SCO2322 family protein [Streptomyces sp. RY43-2]|uniref:SCO2322 family protein n=1 Tax=Streptomyces macrolidinus TaxID=2952607 RepID=A0ABT0ZJ51_9ACTN|nr:SCO2322 family protein [Streptomyces macrolidinus]MCN9243586.1 SCO2322 family protein [Streptomyces macrolidinus]